MTRAQREAIGIVLCLFLLAAMVCYIRAVIEPAQYERTGFYEW